MYFSTSQANDLNLILTRKPKQIQPNFRSFNPILEEDSNADLEEACATVKISR